MQKTMKKIAEVMANVAMKSAKGTCKEVSFDGIYQPKRPAALDQMMKSEK